MTAPVNLEALLHYAGFALDVLSGSEAVAAEEFLDDTRAKVQASAAGAARTMKLLHTKGGDPIALLEPGFPQVALDDGLEVTEIPVITDPDQLEQRPFLNLQVDTAGEGHARYYVRATTGKARALELGAAVDESDQRWVRVRGTDFGAVRELFERLIGESSFEVTW